MTFHFPNVLLVLCLVGCAASQAERKPSPALAPPASTELAALKRGPLRVRTTGTANSAHHAVVAERGAEAISEALREAGVDVRGDAQTELVIHLNSFDSRPNAIDRCVSVSGRISQPDADFLPFTASAERCTRRNLRPTGWNDSDPIVAGVATTLLALLSELPSSADGELLARLYAGAVRDLLTRLDLQRR
jgi:hypothetical protein